MLRRLYDWVMRLSASRHAGWALFAVAFAESSFFPVPPDTMLAPMVLARPENTWRYAAICAAGSIIGGMLGYAIGHLFWETAGLWLIGVLHLPLAKVEIYRQSFATHSYMILVQGLTPIPYKLITITTGLAHFTLWKFVAASCVTRSTRFFGVAALVRRFGPTLLPVIERRLALFAGIAVALVVVLIVAVKLLH